LVPFKVSLRIIGKKGGNANQYDDNLANGWRTWYSSFDNGAALLDLCTSNEALLLLTLETADKTEKTYASTPSPKPPSVRQSAGKLQSRLELQALK
jgi:hypothetical protein